MIWYNWAKIRQNIICVAAPQAPVGGWGPRSDPLKSLVMGPSLLDNCYLENKSHKLIRLNPPPPLRERGGGSTLIFGKTRFGDWGLEKSPTHRGNFWRSFGVSTPFALRVTATPIIRRRLQLNLIKHPPTQKVTHLVDNHLLGIPI